jgi:hypothetical protein
MLTCSVCFQVRRELCPTEEELNMLKSSVLHNLHLLAGQGGKGGQVGLCKGPKSRAVDSEHGASKGGSSQLCT